tara:strand:+ start:243 stop:617 length:375 start_codon:yes stop_codon:yes gene_type:complete
MKLKKKILFIGVAISVIAVFTYVGNASTINSEQLQNRNGLAYEINSNTPYKGFAQSFWKNGKKRSEVNLKAGKQDGLVITWYENGQKSAEGNYKKGQLNGLVTTWHENGQVKKKENYKNGKLIS